MSTIDMTQVAGIQAVNAEGNVIGTLSVDDLTELVSAKIIQEAKNEAVSARSASVMSEASTLAATDEYEDQLALDTNPAYIRSLDTNGNPKRTAIASLASVVGGLLGINSSWFCQRGVLVDGDFNNCTSTGIFYVQGNNKNSPHEAWGALMVFEHGYDVIFQMSIDNTNQYRYTRFRYVNKWTSWKAF